MWNVDGIQISRLFEEICIDMCLVGLKEQGHYANLVV